MTEDPALAEALARVVSLYPGVPAARLVHDLAIKGAETAAEERAESDRKIQELIKLSTEGEGLMTPEGLKRIDEDAWGG
ncbi:MAG: hypothetical protein ACRDLR_04760 [Gaiellaceae bacterium]